MTPLSSRHVAIALLASLGLNLFLGGMIFSGWLSHRAQVAAHMGTPLRVMRGFEAIDDGDNPAVSAIRAGHAANIRRNVTGLHEARRELRRVLAAPDFDAAKLESALVDIRARSQAAQTAIHAALSEIVPALTPEQRRRFAEAASRRRPFRGRPRPDRDPAAMTPPPQ